MHNFYLCQKRKVIVLGLFVYLLDYSKGCEQILIKFLEGQEHGLRNKWLDVGGDPGHDLDPVIFIGYNYVPDCVKSSVFASWQY